MILSTVGWSYWTTDTVRVTSLTSVGITGINILTNRASCWADGSSNDEIILCGTDISTRRAIVFGSIKTGQTCRITSSTIICCSVLIVANRAVKNTSIILKIKNQTWGRMSTTKTICWRSLTSWALWRAEKAKHRSWVGILAIRTSLTANSGSIDKKVIFYISLAWCAFQNGGSGAGGTAGMTISAYFGGHISILTRGTWDSTLSSIKEISNSIDTLAGLASIVISASGTGLIASNTFKIGCILVLSRIAWCSACVSYCQL